MIVINHRLDNINYFLTLSTADAVRLPNEIIYVAGDSLGESDSGDANIHCSGLYSLPDYLKIKERFDLSNCYNLSHLPDHLDVGEHLILKGCTSLSSVFPATMSPIKYQIQVDADRIDEFRRNNPRFADKIC